MDSLFKVRTWLVPVIILIFLSILTGLALGIRIYGLAPVSFIRKDVQISSRKFTRKFYTIGQFTIAIILIAGTIGALRQIRYMQKDAFTMNIDQTLVVKRPVAREFNTSQKSFQEVTFKIP